MALRVLIVGLGERGRQWAGEIERDNGWKLEAGAEIAVGGGDTGFPVYADLDQALDRHRVQAALVATPAEQHCNVVKQLLERGIPVLVEKPMATSLDDAKKMVTLAQRRGVPLIVGQNHRYLRSHRTVRRVLQSGAIGDVRLVDVRYYRVPHLMAPSLARSANRIMWGMGVHHLDALRWALGKEADGVFAQVSSTDDSLGSTLQTTIRFKDGPRATYVATYESSGHQFFESGQEFYARFIGSEGTLHVFQRWLLLCLNDRLPRPIRRGRRVMSEERVLLEQLRRAIEDGVEPECSGRDNLHTMGLVEACLHSAETRRWVDLKESIIDA